MKEIGRRQFVKYAACGLTALALGPRLPLSSMFGTKAYAQETLNINLGMMAADVEMVDTIRVPHWVFTLDGQPTLPGPAIFHFAGDTLNIRVTNNLVEPDRPNRTREIVIVGTAKATGPIPKGQTRTLTIAANELPPGTYLYKDATMDPISRVMGLHGPLVILPSPMATNPYGDFSTPQVTALFNALGVGVPFDPEALFPGDPWFATTDANPDYDPHTDPQSSDFHHHEDFIHHVNSPVFERFLYRSRIWLHSSIDPVLNREIAGGTIPTPENFVARFDPQYYSINGRQGVFSHHAPDVEPSSTVGEPHVIRLLNAGLVTHSPHIHANHVYIIAVNNVVGSGGGVYFGNDPAEDNLFFVDTITLAPEDRIDWVAPFIRPPDIPRVLTDGTIHRPGEPVTNGATLVPLDELIPEELTELLDGGIPQTWPMHSHMELDQTAAGGNYPQGAVTGWAIIGEFGRLFFSGAQTHGSL
jgi:FtsP/CotA-like multicopper oxidase with cupredoxin domain